MNYYELTAFSRKDMQEYMFSAQYDKHNGPDGANQHKITFTVDESNQDGMHKFIANMKKGKELIMMLYETVDNNGEQNEEVADLVNETAEKTRVRLMRQMHALIQDVANNNKVDSAVIKNKVKEFLMKKGYMKTSSKELTSNGLAAGIYYLRNEFFKS